MKSSKPAIVLIAHDLRSCYNVGSLLRTCDGLGVTKFIATGTTPYPMQENDTRLPHIASRAHKQIAKTALGAESSVSTIHYESLESAIEPLQKSGYAVYALEQAKDSKLLGSFMPAFPCVLIVGNEPKGLDEESQELCDAIIEIPMKGQKESFNVTIAASIALWEISSPSRS